MTGLEDPERKDGHDEVDRPRGSRDTDERLEEAVDQRLNLEDQESSIVEDSEDYWELSGQLDALNSALDTLEQENDRIHEALKELLEDNRQTRQMFRDQAMSSNKPEATKEGEIKQREEGQEKQK